MNRIDFTFSDTIAGYVTASDAKSGTFSLRTPGGSEFQARLAPSAYAEYTRNLGESYQDASGQMRSLQPGQYVFAYGTFYPEGGNNNFEAMHLVLAGRGPGEFAHEKQDWWINQVREIGDFYLDSQFEGGEVDFTKYRTNLFLDGRKLPSGIQEIDTISRTVYGFASAFLMTGEDRFLEAAEKGTRYLQEKACKRDREHEGIVYWLHALDVTPGGTKEHLGSLFGDDYGAMAAYEQIYALAGPIQTYRITGDPSIYADTEKTIALFDRFFLDRGPHGGYFSHVTTDTFDPRAESLGHNRARKNWNSVGDHAPAYLINLWLATGEDRFADFLQMTFDTIESRFPAKDGSPFVQEKFHEDWSPDKTWGWQQDRAVAGHDLKIAWNLMRMNSLREKQQYVALATKLADTMPGVGMDKQRGGWWDVVERMKQPGQEFHHFAFHDRKAWWQQEQGILAYLILNGCLRNPRYRSLAQESAAFYNAWFLDHDSGAVYFNTLASGLPFLLGNERDKGSHSMGAYHSTELCYLAAVYTNLLITKQPMDFYFRPKPNGFRDNVLRVSPDILPPGSIRISDVWIDGHPYHDFDANALTVRLPGSQTDHVQHLSRRRAGGLRPHHLQGGSKVKVRITPV